MAFFTENLLTLILFLPAGAAVLLALLPARNVKLIRWIALLASLVTFAFSLVLWFQYDPTLEGFQFQTKVDWYQVINSSFHLGIDGISLTMVLLTTILTPLAVLTSFTIKERVKAYMVLFMLLEMGMLGVFLSLDLLLFFVFWEFGLVPMYFLINQWGNEKDEREIWKGIKIKARTYASIKFMIYTMAGSLGLLLAIQMIGVSAGTFDIPQLFMIWKDVQGSFFGLDMNAVKTIAFWAFVVAFALKVPIWPFHTWLPDAHTEAPTAGSMILAGVLLKLGAYGFIRLVLPLYPEQAKQYAGVLAILAVAAIIIGALNSFGQEDFKRLVAYSSVNHMGFVILGIAAAARVQGGENATLALNGAVLQMFNHGISAAAMFFLVGVIYERTHTRDMNEYGGLFPLVPIYGGVLLFSSMAALGLPGLNGFVSEFLVVRGSWPVFSVYTALGMVGLFFTGAYVLKSLKKVLHGPLNESWQGKLTDMNTREMIVVVPLMALMLWIGIWPAWILKVINWTVGWMF